MPIGEEPIKAAMKWIDEQLRERPGADLLALVEQASRRYDLTPLDEDFLVRNLAKRAPPNT